VRIDLHLHSTASDGSLPPRELVCAARSGGLHVIALTDHDTTVGVPEAVSAAESTIQVIPGIEISSHHAGADLHVLGYFVDPLHPAILAYAERAVSERSERMRAMLGRLASLGIGVAWEEVEAAAGPGSRVVGRPHLARALVQGGFASSFSDAFERWIGDAGPAYLPTELITPADAIELVHAVGGLAVWAHPRPDVLERDLRRLERWGLDGVECIRPRADAAESLRMERLARELGLVVTGGSDWHGPWHGRLGAFSVSEDEVGEFLDRAGM
jgi:predicted metal-dependent phosphoesterase TrpH